MAETPTTPPTGPDDVAAQIAAIKARRRVADGIAVAGFVTILIARWADAPTMLTEVLLGGTLIAAFVGFGMLVQLRRLEPRGVRDRDFF